LAMHLYQDDNQGYFPPRSNNNRWPSRLFESYQNLKVLVCPNDVLTPATGAGNPANFPADAAPRSYIINGWNDFMKGKLSSADMDLYMAGTYLGSFKEGQIPHPSDTVLFGEKMSSSTHYYMDLLEPESNGAVGNDLFELDRSRHGGKDAQNSGTGGSNYAFMDGSVRYVKYGSILWPINLWAVSDAARTEYAVNQ
jgi:prepilin-type processing-associated H-X9-DG protein